MRKYLALLTILSILALAACGKTDNPTEKPVVDNAGVEENSNKTNGGEQSLKLQVLKGDKEAGVTLENSPLYNELEKVIQENPDIGADNDFSVYVVDTYGDDEGNSKLVLLGSTVYQ